RSDRDAASAAGLAARIPEDRPAVFGSRLPVASAARRKGDSGMIEDFDHTLEKLLQLEFGKPLPFDLSFTAPDREFRPVSTNNRTLNCYLYEINEDRALRNQQPTLRRTVTGLIETQYAPSRVKLSYC